MQRMLQCGHGSKTVEMRHSPTACAMPTMLQCGHGSKTVEIPPRFEAPPVSSGRLQCGHGSKTVEISWAIAGVRALLSLQCGHGSKTVEIRYHHRPTADARPLQCGHGSKTVEIPKWPMPPFTASDASMRPRLQDRGDYKMRVNASSGLVASMRSRLQDRGDTLKLCFAHDVANSFNAATAPKPWSYQEVQRSDPRQQSFNAATAPRPWR